MSTPSSFSSSQRSTLFRAALPTATATAPLACSEVTQRIGYLACLGVDGVWLSSFYPCALVHGGYDAAD